MNEEELVYLTAFNVLTGRTPVIVKNNPKWDDDIDKDLGLNYFDNKKKVWFCNVPDYYFSCNNGLGKKYMYELRRCERMRANQKIKLISCSNKNKYILGKIDGVYLDTGKVSRRCMLVDIILEKEV